MNELVEKWMNERAEMREALEALESGNVHFGNPWEGRAEAMIAELRRKISNLDRLIETEKGRKI